MVIDSEKLKKIIDKGYVKGLNIVMRDISFVLLSNTYDNIYIAHKVLYNVDAENVAEEYNNSERIKFIRKELKALEDAEVRVKSKKSKNTDDDITYSENKAGMIKELKHLEAIRKNNVLEPKEDIALSSKIADLRVKLSEKFSTKEANDEQRIIVQKKFDFVCPYMNRECSYQTKEFVMEKYDLVERGSE